MTSISFRGTLKSFWDLTGKNAILVQIALLSMSQTDFQNQSIPPGKHFSDVRGLPFYYLNIGFLEYLQISGEIRYPNGPIG